VPYEKREEAKAAGFRWDAEARRWYATTPEIAERIKAAKKGDSAAAASSTSSAKSVSSTKPPIDAKVTQAPVTADAGRFYFRVPFERKDEAKALGMRFDGDRKQWFAPNPEIAAAAAAFPSTAVNQHRNGTPVKTGPTP
jgi:Domain of unknown function (DUF5710)